MHGSMYGGNFGGFGLVLPLLILVVWGMIDGRKRQFHFKRERIGFKIVKYCPRCKEWRTFVKCAHPIAAFIFLILIISNPAFILLLPLFPKYCTKCHCRASKASFQAPLTLKHLIKQIRE